MKKRTHKEILKDILKVLNDEKEYSYGSLERKVNTNWQTIRDNCKLLEIFGAIIISKDNRIKITRRGIEFLRKI